MGAKLIITVVDNPSWLTERICEGFSDGEIRDGAAKSRRTPRRPNKNRPKDWRLQTQASQFLHRPSFFQFPSVWLIVVLMN